MDAIITIDVNQRILLFNAAAKNMFDCTSVEVIGKSVERFIPERFRKTHDKHSRAFGRTGVTNREMGSMGAIKGVVKKLAGPEDGNFQSSCRLNG